MALSSLSYEHYATMVLKYWSSTVNFAILLLADIQRH